MVPAEIVGDEIERLGYTEFDKRAFLVGFSVGRTDPALMQDEKELRSIVRIVLPPNRAA